MVIELATGHFGKIKEHEDGEAKADNNGDHVEDNFQHGEGNFIPATGLMHKVMDEQSGQAKDAQNDSTNENNCVVLPLEAAVDEEEHADDAAQHL